MRQRKVHSPVNCPAGQFTGEWTFRWRMEQAGWTFNTGQTDSGTVVAAVVNGSPGVLPAGLLPLAHYRIEGGALRVIAITRSAPPSMR